MSNWQNITHSTPQGSCLWPLLFLIFCSDLRLNLIYLSCIQFADDTTLYNADKNLSVLKCCIENDVATIMDWFLANSLTLNVQKTKVLLFSPKLNKQTQFDLEIENCKIIRDKETKFLGVILGNELTWTAHLTNVITKMKRNFGLLCRGKKLLTNHGLKMLYYAQIFSHMTYCIVVWGSMASEHLLSKLRVEKNKCIKLLNSSLRLTEIYNEYNILMVDEVIDLELKKTWV